MNPTPPLAPGGTAPLETSVRLRLRDTDLTPQFSTTGTLTYTADRPYEVRLLILNRLDPTDEPVLWTLSRDALVSAALHGINLPGLDAIITHVVTERAPIGHPVREYPTVRIALHETDCTEPMALARFTGNVTYLDIDIAGPLRQLLEASLRAVPLGSESRFMDMDAVVAALVGGC